MNDANEPGEKNPQSESNHEAKPGWLADDALTLDWLQLVEQYRSECDAADRQRLLKEPPVKEAGS